MSSARERVLLDGVVAGQEAAVATFLAQVMPSIWRAVLAIEADAKGAAAAVPRVIEALKADGFALLRQFDARRTLSDFVALQARRVLIGEICQCFQEGQRPWAKFERAFGAGIRRRIARRFPREGEAAREDLYQEVCLKLIENDYHRLCSVTQRHRFEEYVCAVVERLLIDLMRKDAPRRRLPAAVAALPEFDQAIFRALAWQGMPTDSSVLAVALVTRFAETDRVTVEAALERLRPLIEKARLPPAQEVPLDGVAECASLADAALNPEDALLAREAEAERAALLRAIRDDVRRMAPAQRRYLEITLSEAEPIPPREMARRLGAPVEEVHRIKARVMRRLKALVETLNNANSSVSQEDEERSDD